MRMFFSRLALAWVWLLITCPTLAAEPVVKEIVRKYRISGQTAQDLRREMNLKGPAGAGGRRFDAYTAWWVKWNYRWWESPSECRITAVATQVRVSYTLPAWDQYDRSSDELKQQWDRYYQALLAHEKGHREFGLRAAREIEQVIWDLGRRGTCAQLEREANAVAQAALDRYILMEEQYDADTAHGAATGAVFP
ncbi:MAG: hypothetical protein [Olavius algarvensis Delta 4 endosymbiont]|nr:MAG: hypothetical protein [Olavius algarvensis Delta 4 endosymbiont]